MNKQELIGTLRKLLTKPSEMQGTEFDCGHDYGIRRAIVLAKQLDEQEKPVVPRFVADWIEWCKKNNVTLLGAMSPIDELDTAICDDKKVESLDAFKWATKNQETFAKAWLFCYEVEKEKLYTVEIPNPNGGTHLVLCKDCDGKLFIETFHIDTWETFEKCKLTESEIKEDFEWAWKFAEPEEVKE